MKFNITKLEIENFRSIQSKTVIEIKPGLFSVEGINNDEKQSGNGSGKSSIVSALYWCLTGNALTNEVLADDIVNSKINKDCRVTTYIDSSQGEIKITRTRKDTEFGNNLLLQIGSQDLSCHKIADTQDRINQLLKIPFELLHSTIIMTHDMKSAFSELTPQQRVQSLETIRDYTLWDKVREEANKDIKTLNKQIQECTLTISKNEGIRDTYNKMIEKVNQELNDLVKNFDLEKINNDIQALTDEKTKNNNEIAKLQAEINENENKLSNFEETDLPKALNTLVEEANNIKLEIKNIEYAKKDKEREISVINDWFKNDICPTCGQPFKRTEEEKALKTNELNKLTSKIKELDTQLITLNNTVTAKRVEWSKLNTELQSYEGKKKEIRTAITDLRKKLEVSSANSNEIDKQILQLTKDRDTHNTNVTKINDQLINYTNEIANVTKILEDTNKQKSLFEIQRQLSDYYYKLLGAKGELRPYLLNKDIAYLNHCMQKYMRYFFENTDAQLLLNGPVIDIVINSNGIQKKVTSLSGGEKKRLNISIQLALYDLIKTTSQVSFNLLWLDEIESELDPAGVNQLIEVIEDKTEDGIETVMWITNNDMVKENIPHKIICTKQFGKTTIEEQ